MQGFYKEGALEDYIGSLKEEMASLPEHERKHYEDLIQQALEFDKNTPADGGETYLKAFTPFVKKCAKLVDQKPEITDLVKTTKDTAEKKLLEVAGPKDGYEN